MRHWIGEDFWAEMNGFELQGGSVQACRRTDDAQTESLDGREALRDCAGSFAQRGAHRTDCPKASGLRGVDQEVAGVVFEGGGVIQEELLSSCARGSE